MITDVIMPEMSGPELAERMTAERPGLKVIFMSGYTADAMANHHKLSSEAILIEKPYVGSDLLRAVREVLDAEEPTPGAED